MKPIERERLVPAPIGALEVVIAAQESVDALRAIAACRHSPAASSNTIGNACAAAVSFASASCTSSFVGRTRARCFRIFACGLGGQARGTGKGGAHQRDGAKHVGAHERTPGRDRRPKSCPTTAETSRWPNAATRPSASLDEIQEAKGAEIPIVIAGPSRWCGHSRAGRAPRHGSPPKRAAASPFARNRRAPGKPCSRRTSGRSAPSKPASSTCMRSPLMPRMKRARMPRGRTSLWKGAILVILAFLASLAVIVQWGMVRPAQIDPVIATSHPSAGPCRTPQDFRFEMRALPPPLDERIMRDVAMHWIIGL